MQELTAPLIAAALKTTLIGRKIVYYPTVTSTMDTARQQIQEKAAEGTVIIAGEQTGGRGRLKRSWLSPPGNIALSIILYPDIAALPYLMMIASLAVAHSIEAVTGIKTQIKWPNDILIWGKKVGGILIENEVKGNKAASIIGIGINVALNAAAYPEIKDTAVSLKSDAKSDLRVAIIRALLTEFDRLYRILPDGKSIFTAWRNRLLTLGQKVQATSANEVIEGTAESVDESGALVIRKADGSLVKVVVGDVTLRE